ncbi:hypothetical protein AN1824.2 [Aspergillus nidulans FGSC A4]|uniref:Zn(II)2Cys6 transcription factor (Eurofung) n=1 Tax=Emericella nidulans (strain FGSC A4 / ATCC 38163 / CBS 112.46 / NRRL 194 / M139) TaxID=227321 RepID=Q5BCA6_EMENI|nr:hypothetical protein [Aspergillus nidulans FGSC A4]EAA64989.1 hypothetical protein AN1824.2 [Aspergillus nidulans FGSC A4]CBF85633.1 TPA: Putative Zn(II)2Cys6 transcription factor (Eurofung) [Aspergillus nidulans FGSC A4]|eukprot:XP_659428.1 hypothetical protein AN1824.2 [Aspergillus nidulans FGSC A4]
MTVACTECRAQHLRCDFKKPTCSRCSDARLACIYLPSRRGGRRKPAALAARQVPSPSHSGTSLEKKDQPPALVSDARLVGLYYEHFHPAHPILVPSRLYESRDYPRYLRHVVAFIGSQYSAVLSKDSLAEATALELSTTVDRTPCMVQALLLYSIILSARNEHHQAEISLARATEIALELGMYQKEFAATMADSQEPEAESLRRTWWELFVVEVYTAALQPKPQLQLRCSQVAYDVPLPCEESLYTSQETIPHPPSLDSFSMRLFTDEDEDEAAIHRYSSYSYRIEAARILARVLVLNNLPETQTHPDHAQAVTNALVSWANHLPPQKAASGIIDMYGGVDEMLFQAHITIHYASMLLHLPRSNLSPSLDAPDSPGHGHAGSKTIYPAIPSIRLPPSSARQVHDVMATEASKSLTNLLSMRPCASARTYSPFAVSGLLLGGLMQLFTSEHHPPACADHHHNRVILVLGALKLLRQNWALAREAHRQLRLAAAETVSIISSCRRSVALASAGLTSTAGGNKSPSNCSWTPRLVPAGGNPGLRNEASPPLATSPVFLSEYVDPTCSDPFLFDRLSGLAGVDYLQLLVY